MKIRPSGSRVVPCGRTDRQTDMTKLRVAFRKFAKAPKKHTNTFRVQDLEFFNAEPGGT
jgi:hypothetical protein